jgi:hypothetical protein
MSRWNVELESRNGRAKAFEAANFFYGLVVHLRLEPPKGSTEVLRFLRFYDDEGTPIERTFAVVDPQRLALERGNGTPLDKKLVRWSPFVFDCSNLIDALAPDRVLRVFMALKTKPQTDFDGFDLQLHVHGPSFESHPTCSGCTVVLERFWSDAEWERRVVLSGAPAIQALVEDWIDIEEDCNLSLGKWSQSSIVEPNNVPLADAPMAVKGANSSGTQKNSSASSESNSDSRYSSVQWIARQKVSGGLALIWILLIVVGVGFVKLNQPDKAETVKQATPASAPPVKRLNNSTVEPSPQPTNQGSSQECLNVWTEDPSCKLTTSGGIRK